MKWITHEAAAVGAAFFLGMPPEGLAGVAIGSVLPDVIDQKVSALVPGLRQVVFNRIHRGASHWFGWWLVLFLAGFGKMAELTFPGHNATTLFLTGVGFGALAHIILDMCTITGVPVAPWSRKHMVALKLCKTGSLQEYLFLGVLLAVFAFLARQDLSPLIQKMERHFRAFL